MIRLFFEEDRLETTLSIIMTVLKAVNTDAVAYTCTCFLRHPITLCFTEYGVMPFSHIPEIIIPYDAMCRDQLVCAMEMCKSIDDSKMYVSGSKMNRGFFVQSVQHDKYYIPQVLIIDKLVSLLRRYNAPQCVELKIMNQIIGECTWKIDKEDDGKSPVCNS